METATAAVMEMITKGRRFTIGMDCWSKKGLSASYLGISVCFFHPKHQASLHFLLNLYQIAHPHTGEMIASKLCSSMNQWGIEPKKVLMVVTDNGVNMVKAVCVANITVLESDSETETDIDSENDEVNEGFVDEERQESEGDDNDEDAPDNNDDDGSDPIEEISAAITLHRFPCIAHTIQLVLKEVENNVAYSKVLNKTRALVRKIRISSVATEKMITQCGETVVTECSKRWNSNMFVIERLLEVEDTVVVTLTELKWDGLLASEWQK